MGPNIVHRHGVPLGTVRCPAPMYNIGAAISCSYLILYYLLCRNCLDDVDCLFTGKIIHNIAQNM